MSLFDHLVDEALRNKAGFAPLRMVVEKELLHHDILREMSSAGLLARLTFIGGTCLRACYGSSRLSEDLDFTGGADFSRDNLTTLARVLVERLQDKYGLTVEVSEPSRETGNVDTWKLKVQTRPGQRDLPAQRINIDICAVPSHEPRPMMLSNHYGVDMGTGGLIVQAESREEILADKLLALALRPGRLKNRDLWDMTWLHQQGVALPLALVPLKLRDHRCDTQRFLGLLAERRKALLSEAQLYDDFRAEMRRFLPTAVVAETVEQPAFWSYLTTLVAEQCQQARDFLSNDQQAPRFRM
ncbi:nucleotidyl transferase AbiEii/AbiGii toxin family protein [Sedimenticola hydrogenitrophicus]|uniref:nucleotidyl transferase AbiEii/AbiGii toxin family protein n=1 Tax=Sedimenticola hydrogenitrophicus TaxID=2967975 RepID=UPI0023AEF7A1|nr:nucleotidyl transferase AbiEii/AbiGii toxin family protein [Sedimenticola hydrogenitrophicus]